MNELYFPYLNPLKFQKITPEPIPQYLSKHIDDWHFVDTIRSWESDTPFCHEWLSVDAIRLQIESNYSPGDLKVLNEDGNLIYNLPWEVRQQSFFRPAFFIRQIDIDLATFDLGYYIFKIADKLISEPISINETLEDSLYIEFTHFQTKDGIFFDSPFFPTIRVPGILKFLPPGSKDTIYEDQSLNATILHSVGYRIWRLIIGGKRGVPPWFIDKVFRMLSCENFKIDGRYYTKATENATFEQIEVDGWPMAGYSIDLRERLHRDGLIFQDDTPIVGRTGMIAVIDTKGFGLNDISGDYLEIIDIN